MKKPKGKWVLVLMESLAGTGHKFATTRLRQAVEKHELYRFDPLVRSWVLYREVKKLKSIR